MDRVRNLKLKMKNAKQQIKIKSIAIFLIVFSFSFFALHLSEVNAARLYFETPVQEVGVGQEMEITLYVDSQGETINALEGTIHLPEILRAEEIRDGDTLIALWGERPQINADGAIIFGGIIPGGWKGTDGKIFSFIAKTENQGADVVIVSDAAVLLHDGQGSETKVRAEPLMLLVDESVLVTPITFDYYDNEAPEPFTLILAQDPDIFGGDYFLVFIAQDKGSGIDRYEVQETKQLLEDERSGLPVLPDRQAGGKAGKWQSVESPYRIVDQRLESFVYIRAVDREDNIRVALFEPAPIPARGISKVVYTTLIILLALIAFFKYRRRRKRRFNRYRRF